MGDVITRPGIRFPSPTGIVCNMMPFVQGDPDSLPEWCAPYARAVREHALERGEVGYLTVQESRVPAGGSQRGYSRSGAARNVHIEVGRSDARLHWGSAPTHWGRGHRVTLEESTRVLIANSIPGTCRVWDALDTGPTPDGDLADRLHLYPERGGDTMGGGDMREISISTPHECVPQAAGGWRQFFRIVGAGVSGREDHFTPNPRLGALDA